MMKKLARLFTIRTKFEAFCAIYAMALGSVTRGAHYLETYPGAPGIMLYIACCSAVMIVGGLMIDGVTLKQEREAERESLYASRFPHPSR